MANTAILKSENLWKPQVFNHTTHDAGGKGLLCLGFYLSHLVWIFIRYAAQIVICLVMECCSRHEWRRYEIRYTCSYYLSKIRKIMHSETHLDLRVSDNGLLTCIKSVQKLSCNRPCFRDARSNSKKAFLFTLKNSVTRLIQGQSWNLSLLDKLCAARHSERLGMCIYFRSPQGGLPVYTASHPKVRRTVTVVPVRILGWFVSFVQRNASTILVPNAEAKRPH